MAKVAIEPKILKGFQDTLPSVALARKEMIRRVEDVFSSFGFAPIDTPALEYAEILLGKGSSETDKQTYRFEDLGGRDVALRFDLTVPLARFAAMHINDLGTPFKRYHIAPVWRAEKPQRGRYREFIQCDFDTIGSDSVFADAEILSIVNSALKALEIEHTIRVNNRQVLNGLLESLGVADRSVVVLRAIDKLDKLGREAVETELLEVGQLEKSQVDVVFRYLELASGERSNHEILGVLSEMLKGNALGMRGVDQLTQLISVLTDSGVSERTVMIDVSIARGLDYYTGTVFETRMHALPGIGSICSGGRYDNLASLYTNRKLPGVGGSIGLDRILGAYEELGRFKKQSSPARVLMALFDQKSKTHSFSCAAQLRSQGIAVDTYPEVGNLGNQLKYADRKGIPLAVLIGETEAAQGVCALKVLATGEQINGIALAALPAKIQELLGSL